MSKYQDMRKLNLYKCPWCTMRKRFNDLISWASIEYCPICRTWEVPYKLRRELERQDKERRDNNG